jgi:hypothetical protein
LPTRSWIALVLALAAAGAHAQPATDAACPAPIAYEQWKESTHPVRWLQVDGRAGGRLSYFPASHTLDPADPQLADLERRWTEARPTIAFYEGPNRPIAEGRDETVRQAGESGLLRFLARRDGVALARLEPAPQDEFRHVRERFGAERAELFYLLREAAQMRERRGLQGPQLQAAMASLIARMQALPGNDPVIRNVDALQAAYATHWTAPANWWDAPLAWFDPLRDGQATGGLFTNDANRASSEYRNAFMVRVLSKAVRDGQRVFAVVGGHHVPLQEAALRCEIAR